MTEYRASSSVGIIGSDTATRNRCTIATDDGNTGLYSEVVSAEDDISLLDDIKAGR